MKKATPLSVPNHPEKAENLEKVDKPSPKKPYVRKPHLTARPFNNENLQQLRNQIARKSQPNYKIRKK